MESIISAEALDANDLIVVSLTHYAAMYDVLGQATDRLAGKVIANLSSDSPEKAREGGSGCVRTVPSSSPAA